MAEQTDIVSSVPGDDLPRDYRWNARAFAVDSAMFTVGMNFISATTVLPSFVARLSDSPVVVGLASGLSSGAWLLPQLLVASAVARMHRKKPLVVRASWIGRPVFFLLGLAIWLLAVPQPTLTLVLVLAGVVLFFFSDALVSVPWFDLLAKAIPPTRRGRVLGTAQVLGGLGGVGAGIAVRYVLGADSQWGFPANYALLFCCAAFFFLASAAAITTIREPESAPPTGEVPSLRQVLALLPRILAEDRGFRRLIVVRILAQYVTIASAFYVLHATRVSGLGPEAVGLFVSAQVAGSLTAGLLMSTLQDRFGPLIHIRVVIGLSALPAALALLAGPLLPALGGRILYLYLVMYFFLGIFMGSMGWPYFNWILEHVEEARRPLYIGMSNTLGAVVMLAPTVGGWVVGAVSYQAAFALALACALTALGLSAGLPSTRGRAAS